jgi:hypothetical protein
MRISLDANLLLKKLALAGLLLFVFSRQAWARYQAALVKDYTGRHQEEYVTQFDRVRLLVRQAQVEVSARLGLIQYREGFQYPLLIRFDDGAPPGVESALAYVQLMEAPRQTPGGPASSVAGFAQQLVVNLDATATSPMDFDKIFYHEMTHAVLNDAVGGEATVKIPHWVQEGLAQYISEEGKGRVIEEAQTVKKSQAHYLLADLDGPYTARAYPQYYLAIEYLYEKHTVNAVQALVRNLILGKSTIDAVEDSTGLPWVKFQDEVRDYSLKVFQDKAQPDF